MLARRQLQVPPGVHLPDTLTCDLFEPRPKAGDCIKLARESQQTAEVDAAVLSSMPAPL